MKKKMIQTLVALPFALAAFAFTTQANAQETVDMHRLYNPNSGEHFYTANTAEKDHLVKVGWKYEGLGWLAPKERNDSAVFRLYNPNAGDHHYTTDFNEMKWLVDVHKWKFEGVGWYSDEQKGVKLYRAYNPNAQAGAHNYTTSLGEQKHLLKVGWKDEGTAWYGVDPNKKDEPSTNPPKDNGGTVTPPKDNSGNQNQGGQTTPPNNSGNSGTVTPPADNSGNGSGQVTPPVDQTPGYDKAIPSDFKLDSRAVAKEVLELLNADRAKVGAPSLEWNEDIIKCAEIRADEIVESYSHNRPDGRRAWTVLEDLALNNRYGFASENNSITIKGTTNKEVAYTIYQNWYNSLQHRKNMLNPAIKYYGSAYRLSDWNGHIAVYGIQYFAGKI